MKERKIETVVKRTSMVEAESDFAYWQARSFAERIQALEEIRREYNNWKYSDAEQRFQRVFRVVKLKRS